MNYKDVLLEFSKIKHKHPELHLKKINESFCLVGNLSFKRIYNKITINDSYKIKIVIPKSYPNDIPKVYSIDNKIPKTYHTNDDNSLCLELDIVIIEKMKYKINLNDFIEKFVIPFFYRYSYIDRYENDPWPDRPHGLNGLIEYYEEKFSIKNDLKQIILIFDFILNKKYRGHLPCPCGSNLKTRNCHGNILLNLKKIPIEYLKLEKFILNYLIKEGIIINGKEF